MKLGAHLLALLAPLTPGDEPIPGATLVGVLSELGLGWRFRTKAGDVVVQVARIEDAPRFAARTPRLALSYRASSPEADAKKLCEALVPVIAKNEDAVLAEIAREAASESAQDGPRVREVEVDRALEPALDGTHELFTLTPYVGCLIGCRFCYAQGPIAQVRRLAQAREVAWGSYVDARVNLPAVLARELGDAPPWPVKLCPILSDPYQAVETKYELTRACLKALLAAPPRPVLVLTRSKLALRDVDLLAAMPDAWVGASLPTLDDAARAHFEPRAASIDERLAMLRTMRAAGVHTFAVVQPLLPGPVDAFADALAGAVESVSLDVLHGTQGAEADFTGAPWAEAATDAWQRARAAELAAALAARGVPVWDGELPPGIRRA